MTHELAWSLGQQDCAGEHSKTDGVLPSAASTTSKIEISSKRLFNAKLHLSLSVHRHNLAVQVTKQAHVSYGPF